MWRVRWCQSAWHHHVDTTVWEHAARALDAAGLPAVRFVTFVRHPVRRVVSEYVTLWCSRCCALLLLLPGPLATAPATGALLRAGAHTHQPSLLRGAACS